MNNTELYISVKCRTNRTTNTTVQGGGRMSMEGGNGGWVSQTPVT